MRQKAETAAKSALILILIVLVIAMMVQTEKLRGTARVINYTGLVRGATQREIKLEITGNPNDELIQNLDDILSGLRYEDGHYNLTRLDDKDYIKKLNTLCSYWKKLKEEIQNVRLVGYENTDIVEMSETYFSLADEVVTAAENYSEGIANWIRWLEIASAIDMIALVGMLIEQTLSALKISGKNKLLEQKAYIDVATSLPNKSKCEELLRDVTFLSEPTACIMFDLNNLKHVNDTLGHSVGDQLIMNFARILRNTIPAKDFVGRCGGDEFMSIIYNTNKNEVEEILKKLKEDVDWFNKCGKSVYVSYAQGAAYSDDYKDCTIRTLFDKADKFMYENKLRSKMSRESKEPH